MKRVKIEVKILMGCKAIMLFSTEANCAVYSDTYPLFATINKELEKAKENIVMLKEQF